MEALVEFTADLSTLDAEILRDIERDVKKVMRRLNLTLPCEEALFHLSGHLRVDIQANWHCDCHGWHIKETDEQNRVVW